MNSWTTSGGITIRQILGLRCNVFLVSGSGKNILVDTSRKSERKSLFRRLDASGIRTLDALILTHTHFDHAENAARVREKYGAKVIVHSSEAGFLQSGCSPIPRGTILPTKILMGLAPQEKIDALFRYEPCEPDLPAGDRLDLSFLGLNAYLIHTPGHSRGSMSLVADDEIALVGDAMIGTFPGSVFTPFADSVQQLTASWGRLLETGCRLFLPAHGRPNTRKLVEKCYLARKPRNEAKSI
jgi:hydroxyacylglutathione hydrolase